MYFAVYIVYLRGEYYCYSGIGEKFKILGRLRLGESYLIMTKVRLES